MATVEYMESQTVSVTLGGAVYNVTASLGGGTRSTGWYNVKAYGAVGDGATDDTTTIQSAIDACDAAGGGVVFFPRGTYMIDATTGLTSGSNMTFDLTSMPTIQAIANSAASYFILKINQQSDVTIRGGNFVGERDDHGGAAIEQGHLILIQGSDNVKVYGVNASDAMGDNLYIGVAATTVYSSNILVDGCHLENAYRNNCSITDAYNVTLTGCTFIGADGTAPKGGLDIEPNPSRVVKNVSVIGCRFTDNVGSGLQIIGTKSAATLTDISVTGCTFSGNGSSTNAHGAIKIDSAENVSIVGCMVEDSDNNGIYAQSLTAGSITGNTMRNLQLNGMYFDTAIGCTISGNVIRQASLAADNTSDGIYIRDSEDVIVSGNMVTQGSSGNNQRYGFLADATATNDRINLFGNSFSGVTGDINHSGTATSAVVMVGAGSPDGVVKAQVGSLFLRTDGESASTLYVKDTGTTSSGWSACANAGIVRGATADDTTPTVLNAGTLLLVANTGATAITQLDNAAAGQRITLIGTSATNPATIADSGNFNLSTAGGTWTANPGDTLTLVTSNGTTWYEVGRSDS